MNGDGLMGQNGAGVGGYLTGVMYPQQQPTSQQKPNRVHAEDELDFDPFQETQKALAELIENEQNHKLRNTGNRCCSDLFVVHVFGTCSLRSLIACRTFT